MSFSVCVVCSEQPAIVSRFVTYYLEQGAEQVFVYLDEGAPDPSLPPDAKLKVVSCAELLESRGLSRRPQYIEEVQITAYGHAFETFSAEWLLVCDIDEFVACPGRITDRLSQLPADWQFAILPVAEAVWGPGDPKFEPFGCSYFRTKAHKGLGRAQSRILYGQNGRFLVAGLVGHCFGKYFVRKDAPVTSLGIHRPESAAPLKGGATHDIRATSELFLYHFDAISYDRWHTKWLGRLEKTRDSNAFQFNKGTQLYIQAFERAQDPEASTRLFSSLSEINHRQARFLTLVGQLRRKHLWENSPDARRLIDKGAFKG